MPEIRFSITKKMDDVIRHITDDIGIDKSEYVKNLIVNDLKAKQEKK